MPALPSSLALTTIADGASIIAADHRNNYASVQTAVNALIAAESGGAVNQFLTATSATAVAWAGSYTAYTPTWTASGTAPAIGNAVVIARYLQVGKLVHCYGRIVFGTTSTYGTGTYLFALPVAPLGSSDRDYGMWDMIHGAARQWAMGELGAGSAVQLVYPGTWPAGTSTVVGQLVPWTWATNDIIAWNLTYEAA